MSISRRELLLCLGAVSAKAFARKIQPEPGVLYFDGNPESPSVQVLGPGQHPVTPIDIGRVPDYMRLLKQPPSRSTARDVEKLAQDLYAALWKPIDDSGIDQTELQISATGILRNFSFESLKRPESLMKSDVEFLGQTSKIRYVVGGPCHCVGVRLGSALAGEKFIYAPMARNGLDLPRLGAAIREARLITQMTGGHLRIGPGASKAQLREDTATSFAVLHLATHATETPEKGPCIALRKGDRRDDDIEFLTLSDVRAMSIAGRLVVLSACESLGPSGAQETIGLGQAFLDAGAEEVIAARWGVDDEAAFAFMRAFYRHLRRGRDSGSALRYARASMITSDVVPYNKAYFWSNFMSLIRG